MILLPHVYSTAWDPVPAFRDERVFHQELRARVAKPEAVHSLQGDYSVAERAGLYGALDLMLATRLHGGIMALAAGVPTLLVAYEKNKTYGTAAWLGLEEYVVDYESLEVKSFCRRIVRLWENREAVREKICQRLPEIKQALQQYTKLTKEALLSG